MGLNSKRLTNLKHKPQHHKTSNVDSVKATIGVPTVQTKTTFKESSKVKYKRLSIRHSCLLELRYQFFFSSQFQEQETATVGSSGAYKPPSMRSGSGAAQTAAPGKKFDSRAGGNYKGIITRESREKSISSSFLISFFDIIIDS